MITQSSAFKVPNTIFRNRRRVVKFLQRELGQLEQRIKKQSHFQNELRLRETELREETNRADHKANDEVNRLREKVNELNFQVRSTI